MDYETFIKHQITDVKIFIKNHFNYDIGELPGEDEFMGDTLNAIISIKLWKDMLAEYEVNLNGTDVYINEIISNLNQVLILGMLGFRIPAYIMIRRSQESLLSFLYYKDHIIEYIKKENIDTKRNNISIEDLKDYIKSFPFVYFKEINEQELRGILSKILQKWAEQYKELSNYVHGSNSNYYELNEYLDDINIDEKSIRKIRDEIITFSSTFNILMVMFFNQTYSKFDEEKKNLIRNTIDFKFNYKKGIRELGFII